MRNAGLNETQAGIKIARRNINNLKYKDDTTLMAKSEEELKSLLMKLKEESEKKNGLKLSIQKIKIKASSPITSWHVDGGKWKQWQTLFSWALKSLQTMIAAMKSRHLLLGREAMTNLDSILKSETSLCYSLIWVISHFIMFNVSIISWCIKHDSLEGKDNFPSRN